MSNVLQWTPTHEHTSIDRPAKTYIGRLYPDTGCHVGDLPSVMTDWNRWRKRERKRGRYCLYRNSFFFRKQFCSKSADVGFIFFYPKRQCIVSTEIWCSKPHHFVMEVAQLGTGIMCRKCILVYLIIIVKNTHKNTHTHTHTHTHTYIYIYIYIL